MKQFTVTDVRVHPGDSAFLIDDSKTAILYDSGFGFTGYQVAEKIRAQLKERKLDYIFLTHSHYDHALGSAYILQVWPEAQVVAGAYAAKIFAKPSAKAVMWDLDTKLACQCGVQDYENLSDCLRVDIPVSDGDIVSAGDFSFVALNLPGHTKCSVGYYCPKEKLLLGCETIGVFNGTDDVVPSYLVGYQMTLDSIRRVEELDIEQILVPHVGLLDKKQTRLYLDLAKKSAVSAAETIWSMLSAGSGKEEIFGWFKETYYHGYIKEIYPMDAMKLNTEIMIELLRRENS